MIEIGDKIRLYRRSKSLTQEQFGQMLGLARTTIVTYETGKVKPTKNFWRKFRDVFPDADLSPDDDQESKPELERVGYMPTEKGLIPVIAITDAGDGIESTDQGYPTGYSDEYVSRPFGMNDPNAYAVRITDLADSMQPLLKPGMLCIASPNLECRNGDMVVVRTSDNNTRIKFIYFKNDKIVLKSQNPNYDDVEIKRKDLMFCHPVIWWRRAK